MDEVLEPDEVIPAGDPIGASDRIDPDAVEVPAYVDALAWVLDDWIRIPVIDRRVGIDGAIGMIPVVGDGLRQPLVGIGSSLSGLIAAADGQSVQLAGIASTIGLATFAIPALAVIAVWLPRRLRFAYKARDLREMMGDPRGIELLAFRALTLRPLPVLLSASPDPLAAWERRDPTALLRLANLALEGEGVRPPTD